VTQRLASGRLADISPTLLDLMGLAKPVEMTGESLLRLPEIGLVGPVGLGSHCGGEARFALLAGHLGMSVDWDTVRLRAGE
jgi:arylsulfatase A-like enzyme